MHYMHVWMVQRPVTAILVFGLILAMCIMLIVWRKDAEYLTFSKDMCPDEHLMKHFLFNGAKFSVIGLSLVSVLVKF